MNNLIQLFELTEKNSAKKLTTNSKIYLSLLYSISNDTILIKKNKDEDFTLENVCYAYWYAINFPYKVITILVKNKEKEKQTFKILESIISEKRLFPENYINAAKSLISMKSSFQKIVRIINGSEIIITSNPDVSCCGRCVNTVLSDEFDIKSEGFAHVMAVSTSNKTFKNCIIHV